MLHRTSIRFRSVAVLALSFVLLGLAVFVWAQSKPPAKKMALRDLVERSSDTSAKLKDPSKFEFVTKGKDTFVVFKATKETVSGPVSCGTCGNCKSLALGGGKSVGCSGSCTGSTKCVLEQF